MLASGPTATRASYFARVLSLALVLAVTSLCLNHLGQAVFTVIGAPNLSLMVRLVAFGKLCEEKFNEHAT